MRPTALAMMVREEGQRGSSRGWNRARAWGSDSSQLAVKCRLSGERVNALCTKFYPQWEISH